MRPLRHALLILACFAVALPAAAAIDKDGAARLKTIVQNFVTEQKKLAEIDGVTKIQLQGETTVEEAGEYYAVTLPYAKITHPNGDQIDLGMISINASPADAPAQWKMRVAVPTPIIMTGKDGKEVSRLTLGGQRAAGIWDEQLQSFVKLDALYKDMAFTGPNSTITIPEAAILYDFSKDAAGKWSGPGTLTLKNFTAINTTGAQALKVAEIKISFAIDQYNATAISAYRKKLAALSETMNKDGTTKTGAMSAEHAAAIASMMTEFFTQAGNGAKARYEFSGLELNIPARGTLPAQVINIPKGFAEIDLGGLLSGKLRLALKLGYKGLKIDPPQESDHNLTPTDTNIDIVIENVPIKEILELGKNTLDAAIASPDMKQFAGLSFLAKLPSLLSQSGTFLTITDTRIGNDDIEMKLEGRARADIAAVNSATADMTATFRGLDVLLKRLQAQQKTVDAPNAAKLGDSIKKLEDLKKYAKEEKTPSGETIHVIHFVMDPKGQMLVNGQDLMKIRAQEKQGIAKPAPVPEAEPGTPVAP